MTHASKEVSTTLYQASTSKKPINFISSSSELNELEVYYTQDDFINQLKNKRRSEIKGYGVSVTSAATQVTASTNEFTYGAILSTQVVEGGSSISLSILLDPLLEPKPIFELTADLPKNADVQTILGSVEIAPGIGIPDARYRDWFPNFVLSDLISDNTAIGLIVAGKRVIPLGYKPFTDINLKLFKNDQGIETGYSNDVSENPIESIKWLNKKLYSHGKRLEEGQFISSGTFIPPLQLEEGIYITGYEKAGSVKVGAKN